MRPASLAAALVAAALLVTVAPGAVIPPNGDANAIAFFNREVGHYAVLPGAKIVETGYFFGRPNGGSSVSLWWGRTPPTGYVPEKALVTQALSGGKVVAYLAQLIAPKVRRVRILMAGTSVYLSTTSCWQKVPGTSSPFGTGEMFLFNDGGSKFSPLANRGNSTSVTFTYAWTPGAKAMETDTFSAGTAPSVDISIAITGADKMHIRRQITPLRTTPVLPVPSPPGLPVPKHLCTRT